MRVTTKGQVTIPRKIREKLGITPAVELEFKEDKGRIYIIKSSQRRNNSKFKKIRGISSFNMTTDEIMAMTRGER